MDPLTIFGVLGLLMIVASRKSTAPAALAKAPMPIGAQRSQPTKAPQSAQAPRANQGNQANQPWYQGTAVAVGGLAVQELLKGASQIGNIFSSNNDDLDTSITQDTVVSVDDYAGSFGDSGEMDSFDSFDPTIDNSTMEA